VSYSMPIVKFSLALLRGAGLLEYPQAYLDCLHDSRTDHHYGNWDEIYRNLGSAKPEYDLWLEKYECILKESKTLPIIDLGCGYGNDSLYLSERGYKVISCDFSVEALNRLAHFIDKPVVKHFDILGGLPFEDCSAKVLIANLSIHYFLWKDTEKIVGDISRVLTEGGYFFCRVNAVSEHDCRSENREEIEANFYKVRGRNKRFFDRKDLERLFQGWETIHIETYTFERFGAAKTVWEVLLRKSVAYPRKGSSVSNYRNKIMSQPIARAGGEDVRDRN
jgi:SAM-dependent methyltransferase